ncbi:hypothetical protein Tco_0708340 [Tanacetum coccineum]
MPLLFLLPLSMACDDTKESGLKAFNVNARPDPLKPRVDNTLSIIEVDLLYKKKISMNFHEIMCYKRMAMLAYGFEIVQAFIVDIEPDIGVKKATNEINACKLSTSLMCERLMWNSCWSHWYWIIEFQGYIDQVNMLMECGGRSKGINKYTSTLRSQVSVI